MDANDDGIVTYNDHDAAIMERKKERNKIMVYFYSVLYFY